MCKNYFTIADDLRRAVYFNQSLEDQYTVQLIIFIQYLSEKYSTVSIRISQSFLDPYCYLAYGV